MPLGSVSRTFRLIVCSFCPQMLHRNSWPLRLAMSPRLPLSYPSFAGEQRQCITSEAVVGSLPSSQPHHSTNAFKTPRRREAFACPCLPGRHAILPSPYPACRMNAPLARALTLTVRLLSIATPPLSCVACRWAIQRAPPTLHAQRQLQLTASSIRFLPVHPREQRDQQDETPLGTRSSRSATYTIDAPLATLCLCDLNASQDMLTLLVIFALMRSANLTR
jgi:hypothetical protein